MPSLTYNQIAEAMRLRKPMTCVYEGHERAFCPIILGHSKGDEKVLIYQFDGCTSKGTLLRPEWKCFFVSKMAAVKISEGEWRAGDLHRQAQSCVENVDLDVNPSSPYSPARKL